MSLLTHPQWIELVATTPWDRREVAVDGGVHAIYAVAGEGVVLPRVPADSVALLAVGACTRVAVVDAEPVLEGHPEIPAAGGRLVAVEAVDARVGAALQLLEVHLEGGAESDRGVDAAGGDGHVELADRRARVEEGADGRVRGVAQRRGAVGAVRREERGGGRGGGGAVEEGEDVAVDEGEGRVPVEGEPVASARRRACGHGGVGDVEHLVGVVDGLDRVGAGAGGEGKLIAVAGDVGVEHGASAAGAGAEGVVDGDGAAGALAVGLRGCGGGEEEEENRERKERVDSA